jgi:hypothetical protein
MFVLLQSPLTWLRHALDSGRAEAYNAAEAQTVHGGPMMIETLHRRIILFLVCALTTGLFLPAQALADAGARAAWEQKVGQKRLKSPAFAYVEDDPTLPRVLLIGDSISIGYTADVRERLKGKANVHRIPTNGGNTNLGLKKIDEWMGDTPWDVIHLNWGLHDIKRVTKGKMDISAPRAVSPEDYASNLRKLLKRLSAGGAKLIWGATSPVPEGAQGRIPGDDIKYNAIAASIVGEFGATVNDLHAAVNGDLPTYQREANVHFHPVGSEHLGEQVAAAISKVLAPNE